MQRVGERVRHGGEDRGVYAVLYAALILVMIGMSALVVDVATLRQNRSNDRAAADSAAIAGVKLLDPLDDGGVQPRAACDAAWSYLQATIVGLTKPSGACTTAPNNFPAAAPATCPTTPFGGPVLAGGGGGYYVTVAWPVAKDAGFLVGDLAPRGSVPAQDFDTEVDGSDPGCDRLGVAVQHDQEFLLGTVLDVDRGRTTSSSVARINPDGGPDEEVAALNVLNKTDCESLVTLGGGKVLVAPTVDNTGAVIGPGIIAVEADGNGTCVGSATGPGGGRVINPNTSSGGSLICASSVPINAAGTNCDGLGSIRSFALDPGGQRSYSDAAITNGNLKPVPVPEGGQYGWNPVTKLYGCVSLSPCATPMPTINYIKKLKDALGSGSLSSNYASGDPTYVQTFPGGFSPVPAPVCAAISGPITLPPGNWYANCHIDVRNGGSLIIEGGTLVVEDGISISADGCFVMNAAVGTCLAKTANNPPLSGVGTNEVTTTQPPTGNAIIYLRGSSCPSVGCFNTAGKTIMPQTFMYSANKQLTVNSTDVTLWTAPGAGKLSAAGRTSLEDRCFIAATTTLSQDCLNSQFAKLTYWSEFAAPSTKPNNFSGQGGLSVVGVFFIPRAYFDVSGGSAYTAAAAQFWADQIRLNGTAFLGLRPDVRTSIRTPTAAVSLIR